MESFFSKLIEQNSLIISELKSINERLEHLEDFQFQVQELVSSNDEIVLNTSKIIDTIDEISIKSGDFGSNSEKLLEELDTTNSLSLASRFVETLSGINESIENRNSSFDQFFDEFNWTNKYGFAGKLEERLSAIQEEISDININRSI